MTSGKLWNYYSDEVNDDKNENDNANNMMNNNKITTSKSFEYKITFIGSTPNDNDTLNIEVLLPLKYLSNFWRFFHLSLID